MDIFTTLKLQKCQDACLSFSRGREIIMLIVNIVDTHRQKQWFLCILCHSLCLNFQCIHKDKVAFTRGQCLLNTGALLLQTCSLGLTSFAIYLPWLWHKHRGVLAWIPGILHIYKNCFLRKRKSWSHKWGRHLVNDVQFLKRHEKDMKLEHATKPTGLLRWQRNCSNRF